MEMRVPCGVTEFRPGIKEPGTVKATNIKRALMRRCQQCDNDKAGCVERSVTNTEVGRVEVEGRDGWAA